VDIDTMLRGDNGLHVWYYSGRPGGGTPQFCAQITTYATGQVLAEGTGPTAAAAMANLAPKDT
jgi:hypothetical protein